MARAEKLPSGSWRIRVQKTVDGKVLKKSITAPTRGEAEFLAEQWKNGVVDDSRPENRTIRQLCEDYIELKRPILSPTTIVGYEKILRNYFTEYMEMKVGTLTKVKLQQMIADEIKTGRSAKSVSNAWGLVSSALRMYDYEFRVQLPERADKVVQVHSPDEIFPAIKGTDIELPCLLAMWCGLTTSEMRGARLSDVRNGVLYINQVCVNVRGVDVYKANGKEEKRTRAIALPKYIQDLLPTEGEYIVTMPRNTIYHKFKRLFPDMTFHQLRHVFATTAAMLNLPPKVVQEMGGWKTPHTMEKVYQHTFRPERIAGQKAMDDYFEGVIRGSFRGSFDSQNDENTAISDIFLSDLRKS